MSAGRWALVKPVHTKTNATVMTARMRALANARSRRLIRLRGRGRGRKGVADGSHAGVGRDNVVERSH